MHLVLINVIDILVEHASYCNLLDTRGRKSAIFALTKSTDHSFPER